jgi:REDY-like protein HapK
LATSREHGRKEVGVAAMVVLVNLQDGVSPGEYERWVLESYAPAVRNLSSVEDWRDYRASGQLGSDAAPPYRYVVTLDVSPEQLGRDIEGEEMQRLLSELHEMAEITQIMAERFA